jgi:hypothetical protein
MQNNIYKPISNSVSADKGQAKADSASTKGSQIKLKVTTESGSNEYLESGSSMNCFQKAIPIMPKPIAVLACALNIVLPGTGISAGVCGIHEMKSYLFSRRHARSCIFDSVVRWPP